jgi:hypothetical protein
MQTFSAPRSASRRVLGVAGGGLVLLGPAVAVYLAPLGREVRLWLMLGCAVGAAWLLGGLLVDLAELGCGWLARHLRRRRAAS